MVLLNACLNQFIQPVPVCPETADFAIALAVLSQSGAADRLVLLDDHHCPTGLISLRNLISRRTMGRELSQVSGSLAELVEPLVLLPQTLLVREVLPHLQGQSQPHFAIVAADGAFLGLLDQIKLLRFLTLPRPDESAGPKAVAAPTTAVQEPVQKPAQKSGQAAQKTELRQQIKRQQRLIQRRETQLGHDRGQTPVTLGLSAAASDFARLNPLPGLIEHLPLPLMLQTSDGQVLAQNSLWREQVGALLDPGWVRQEAAVLLETPIADSSHSPTPTVPPSFEADSLASGNWCQRGSKPNSCICSCTLKTGQEQILQFVKIPIGTLSQPLLPDLSFQKQRSQVTTSSQDWSERFRLATLSERETLTEAPAAPSTATLWLVLAQDITEQQQLARELTAKNADLIQLNRLKDEFLACISHELRTPLTAILGLASLLKDQTLGALNLRQTHYAQLIYQSGRHLMSVVNDILDLTRIETGQLELVPEPVDIATVCDRAFEQASARSPEDAEATETEPRQFTLEIEPGLEFLIADETRLRQMLMHLLSNAIKFTDREQELGLKVDRWGGWIAFTVWDRGIGIPADKQHLIFQKFQQLENPLTRQFEGTGLGLVLTQRLARLHGGDVTFLSKQGEGSQFTILLPPCPPHISLVTGEEAAQPLPSPKAIEPQSRSNLNSSSQSRSGSRSAAPSRLVLVVEAAPQFIETLSEQLTGLGYRVVVARTGTEALEKARRLQPCITFLNPLLPQLSGWDVLTLLKSSRETRQIPVVMMSTKVDEAQAHHSHADGLISLPVQPKALLHSLRQWVTEAQEPHLQPRDSALTILRLSPDILSDPTRSPSTVHLNPLLHSHHYQVLEADDLEQAELLARVWKPIVVLLDRTPSDPVAYFEQFSQHSLLAALPLVTLTQETTQAANQTSGLLVFPCLSDAEESHQESSALLQAIEVAAGYAWRPSILVVDLAMLPGDVIACATDELGCFPKEAEWLRALTQYLQAAGFKGIVGQNWQEVSQQLQSQSVEVLLLGWTGATLSAGAISWLTALEQLDPKPPILVMDHRQHTATPEELVAPPALLRQLATNILPPSLSMTELLQQIRWTIED